ncbi:disease resistance protein RGA5-like [Phragmites australis]|uniref:disease resistance protein RGA5-like n=1 Tax=Phragmites australis TaxID=29695 RepID=UPI002D776FA8|nr:disease resistance protein RGA5-like [Phragmites australis]
MSKQKIVINVNMPCAKSRSKAMELVAKVTGVSSVGVTGDSKDRLEVIGEGVDTVCLVTCLRKKVGRANIVLVEEVKDKKKEEKKRPELPNWCPGYYYHHPPPAGMVVCEEPSSYCHIM